MEQKTEASQAVSELLACPFCGGAARIESNRDWHRLYAEHDESCVFDDEDHALMYPAQPGYLLEIVQVWNRRAALKAQPAPAIAAKPAKYEQRFVSPQGMAAVWHDAQAETFHRHRNNGDLGDGWKHEVRALYAGPPAPTDPYQLDDDDDARFPNDTNVVILHIDRYWTLRGCEDICAALDAKLAPTEAAQGAKFLVGRIGAQEFLNWNRRQPIPLVAIPMEMGVYRKAIEIHQELSNSPEFEGIEAQGEDSARLNWLIENVSSGSIGFINGDFIGSQDFDELKVYIDRARASAETGGVSRADLAKLLSDANPGDAT